MATKRKPVSKKSAPAVEEETVDLGPSEVVDEPDLEAAEEVVESELTPLDYQVLNVAQMNEMVAERLLQLEAQHFRIMLQHVEATSEGGADPMVAAQSVEQMALLVARIEAVRSLTILPGEAPEVSEGE